MNASDQEEKEGRTALLERRVAELQQRYDDHVRRLAKSNERLDELTRSLEVVNEFALTLLDQSTVDEVVWAVARNAVARLGLDDCVVYLMDESGAMLIQRAAHGPKNPEREEIRDPIRIPVGQGIVGTVAATGKPELIADTRLDARYILDDQLRLSEIAVPILYEGRVIGVLDSEHSDVGFFTREHLEVFTTIAAMAAHKIADAIKTERLERMVLELQQAENQLAANQAALREARDRAESASKLKSEFLASMSHEIRTPLNGMLGASGLLQMTELTREQERFVSTMRESGSMLLALINDVLDFSKIEAGMLRLESQPFLVADAVRSSIALFEQTAQTRGLELRADVGQGLDHPVMGDATRIKQILINLVGNAVKYTESGSVTVRASAHEVHNPRRAETARALAANQIRPRRRVHLIVSDSGPGIPKARLEDVFQPFVRGEEGRKVSGSGLGLAICQRLTAALGGTLRYKDAPGGGAEFHLDVVLDLAEKEAGTDAERADHLDAEFAHRNPLHILIAEDNAVNQFVLSSFLESLGYSPVVVENGVSAVDHVRQHPTDLVLMDIQMPQMSGLEATRAIRRAGDSLEQPYVVAVTANALKQDRDEYLQAGMDEYMAKPVDQLALARLLARVTRRRRNAVAARVLRAMYGELMVAAAAADMTSVERQARAMEASAREYNADGVLKACKSLASRAAEPSAEPSAESLLNCLDAVRNAIQDL